VRKALILCKDFKQRFIANVRRSLTFLETKGFGKGVLSLVEQHGFTLKAIIKAYMIVHKDIENFNRQVYQQDENDSEYRAIRDCFFMIPGYGCIFDEYRPFTCVTAFRKCFRDLQLYDFVEAKINEVDADELYRFIRLDLKMSQSAKPRIIINADENLKAKLTPLQRDRQPGQFESLTYYQLTRLADFMTYPFYPEPKCLEGLIKESIFYLMGKVKDTPLIVFVDKLEKGELNNDFEFGLDYVQVFRIKET
jgi:hypothetical protein